MKFFIFACLLAVALAKQNMEYRSSSEESVNISQKKFKQEKNVVILPSKETARNVNEMLYSSSSSNEEFVEASTEKEEKVVEEKHHLKQLNKINPFYQKLNFLQYLQALRQPQIVMNPWDQIKTSASPFIPIVNREPLSTSEESTNFSQEELSEKTVDMESSEIVTEKTELTEEEKNYLKLLHYQKFTLPQYLKIVRQQITMNPWNRIKTNAYQIIPFLEYF